MKNIYLCLHIMPDLVFVNFEWKVLVRFFLGTYARRTKFHMALQTHAIVVQNLSPNPKNNINLPK